jgi:hypothetical protein
VSSRKGRAVAVVVVAIALYVGLIVVVYRLLEGIK